MIEPALRNWNRNTIISGREGEKHMTNEGYEIEIIEYLHCRKCTIQFEDLGVVKEVFYSRIKNGNVRNKNRKSTHGVGYFGYGEYLGCVNNKDTKAYSVWRGMLRRCYDEKNFIDHPTYADATVCEEWHNYQNFAKWYYDNYIEDFEVDKDILIKGNKIYSPETCCFLPKELNVLFKPNVKKTTQGFKKAGNKFTAAYSREHLGTFETEQEAIHTYEAFKQKTEEGIINKYKEVLVKEVYIKLIELSYDRDSV